METVRGKEPVLRAVHKTIKKTKNSQEENKCSEEVTTGQRKDKE